MDLIKTKLILQNNMLYNSGTTLLLLTIAHCKNQNHSSLSKLLQPPLYASESYCKLNRQKQPFSGVHKIGALKNVTFKMSIFKKAPELESHFHKIVRFHPPVLLKKRLQQK